MLLYYVEEPYEGMVNIMGRLAYSREIVTEPTTLNHIQRVNKIFSIQFNFVSKE